LIYESPEDHFAVAIPFIRIGLDRGQKCIYIADDGTEAVVRDAMYAQGIDVERAIATDSLVLEIEDRGHGIPNASLEHITGGGGGVGVGIAGMSERVEQLGGRLEVTSSDRGTTGTTVRVLLPLGKDIG